MDVVFQGRLGKDQDIREVLGDVLALKQGEFGILRISSQQQTLNGRIFLHQRRHILDAEVEDTHETGYAAVRKLLTVKEGNFAYLDAGGEDVPRGQSAVCIDLKALCDLMPDLPETLPGTIVAEEPWRQKIDPKLAEAAQVVREAAAQAAEIGPEESLPRLRKLQQRSLFWQKLLLILFILIVAGTLLDLYVPQLIRFVTSQQITKDLDREALKAVNELRRMLKGAAGKGE